MLFGGKNDHIMGSWSWATPILIPLRLLRVFSKFECEVGMSLMCAPEDQRPYDPYSRIPPNEREVGSILEALVLGNQGL